MYWEKFEFLAHYMNFVSIMVTIIHLHIFQRYKSSLTLINVAGDADKLSSRRYDSTSVGGNKSRPLCGIFFKTRFCGVVMRTDKNYQVHYMHIYTPICAQELSNNLARNEIVWHFTLHLTYNRHRPVRWMLKLQSALLFLTHTHITYTCNILIING